VCVCVLVYEFIHTNTDTHINVHVSYINMYVSVWYIKTSEILANSMSEVKLEVIAQIRLESSQDSTVRDLRARLVCEYACAYAFGCVFCV